MEMTNLTSVGSAAGYARVLAPTTRFRGGALPIGGSIHAGDSARTGILMV